jgi:hypothetical protein
MQTFKFTLTDIKFKLSTTTHSHNKQNLAKVAKPQNNQIMTTLQKNNLSILLFFFANKKEIPTNSTDIFRIIAKQPPTIFPINF